MREQILEEARRFLVNYLKDKEINYEQIHPWRKSWEFVVLHSFRVEAYVQKLLAMEKHSLTEAEITMTLVSAILHDIGRIHQRDGHALIGQQIVQQWLNSNQEFCHKIQYPDRLLFLIERHSSKEEPDSDYCLKLLKDADILDEIGVISMFMASSWLDRSNPYFFSLLQERIEHFEISFCDRKYPLLNTESAKKILLEKRSFVDQFNQQLKDELLGTEMFNNISIEDYFSKKEQTE